MCCYEMFYFCLKFTNTYRIKKNLKLHKERNLNSKFFEKPNFNYQIGVKYAFIVILSNPL